MAHRIWRMDRSVSVKLICVFLLVFNTSECKIRGSLTDEDPSDELWGKPRISNEILNVRANGKVWCNYTVESPNGTVHSPGYPDYYPENQNCWIRLVTPLKNDRIQISFEFFALEHSAGCAYDYFEIFDGNSTNADVLGRFCGTGKPETLIVSSTSQVLLHFRSDDLLNNKGFSLKFSSRSQTAAASTGKTCPVKGDSLSGFVTSPNYPDNYPPNSNCTVILEAAPGRHFVLSFETLEVEYDEMCLFDYVEIRDGPSADSALMVQLCGRKPEVDTLNSSGKSVFIQFISDEFVDRKGFKLIYHSMTLADDEEDDEDDGDETEVAEWLEGQKEVPISEPPLIVAKPENATVVVGERHVLHCLVDGANAAVVWLKDYSFISSSSSHNSSLQLLANNSLIIPKMSSVMEGVYTCVILGENGAQSINAWIRLAEFNDSDTEDDCLIEFLQKPRDTVLSEGNNTFFNCYVKGDANITWFKDGEPIEDLVAASNKRIKLLIENVLLINSVRSIDTGIYTCQATDRLNGCIRIAEAELFVEARQQQQSVKNVCGTPRIALPLKPVRSGKVVAGHNAVNGSFPWQAMLWEVSAGSFCGGSLLNERWVLTAAHCLTEFQRRYNRSLKTKDMLVRLGKHDQSRTEPYELKLNVTKFVLHPSFDESSYDGDIALIKLSQTVRFHERILPVCLAGDDDADDYIASAVYNQSDVIGTITGWGMITERGMPPVYLQEVRLPLVNSLICRQSTSFRVTVNMFCAGYKQQVMGDACHGDSGGPFTVNYRSRWYLIGVVSWGEGCNRVGKYGFYTKVGNYIKWINSVIKDLR